MPGKLWGNQDIGLLEGAQRLRHVELGHEIDRLQRNREHGPQLVALAERGAEVDRDDHVGAGSTRDIDGQVAHETAVDVELTVDLHRCERARHRHARAHHPREIAALEHPHRTRLEIRRHRTIRDRQLVEVRDRHTARNRDQIAEEELELVAGRRSSRQAAPHRRDSRARCPRARRNRPYAASSGRSRRPGSSTRRSSHSSFATRFSISSGAIPAA